MARRHEDWLRQARRDLKAAGDSLAAENYEWAAFQSQQAAEKALKALLRYHNIEASGHTLIHLLARVEELTVVPDDMPPTARELDRHYIQPRYPNGFDSGFPGEFYDEATARRCVAEASRVVSWVEGQLS